MNVHDEMSDDEVLRAAERCLSAIPMAARPDARVIMDRGRTRRRRQLAGLGAAGTAAAAVAALSLAGVFGGGSAPVNTAGTIHTTAFTLVENANGTAKLTLSLRQQFTPAVLQDALARDGIPALVTIGTVCTSDPEPSDPGAISIQLPDGSPVLPPSSGPATPVPPGAVMVINPAKIAAGTELTFNFLDDDQRLHFGVISAGSHTCGGG